MPELDRKALKEAALKAQAIAPGQRERDSERNDGEYGSAPESRIGFDSYFMMDEGGKRLFDSYNSEVAEIHEDDGGGWDENSRRLFDFLADANPATILSLLASLEEAEGAIKRLNGFIATFEREREEATARAEAAEQRERRLREALEGLVGAISVTTGQAGRRSWSVNPTKLPRAYDTARAALSEEEA